MITTPEEEEQDGETDSSTIAFDSLLDEVRLNWCTHSS